MKEFIYLKLKWLHSGIQTKINQSNPKELTEKGSPPYAIILLSSNVNHYCPVKIEKFLPQNLQDSKLHQMNKLHW
ncbi:MAG: hypothetical protein FD170_362 [Bacteroidetes bacterium]|nr:MAG: hypothetical protein FD170_362 [Bacteroidota bacterium]